MERNRREREEDDLSKLIRRERYREDIWSKDNLDNQSRRSNQTIKKESEKERQTEREREKKERKTEREKDKEREKHAKR